jgi:hypothetical protein
MRRGIPGAGMRTGSRQGFHFRAKAPGGPIRTDSALRNAAYLVVPMVSWNFACENQKSMLYVFPPEE